MKTILWAQNEDAIMKDTFIINNEVSSASDTKEQNQAFSELTNASLSVEMSPELRKKLSKKSGFSESANFSIENGTYYIQGLFVEKDNANRNMAYMFLTTECESFEEATDRLRHTASLIGRHCIDSDLKLIDRYINLPKKKIRFLVSIGLICLIITTFIIWNISI